ncbi:hypothetical protein RYX36_011407 [Vicia faba]
MELDCGDDYLIDNLDLDTINIDSDDFLREILLETPQSLNCSESENDSVAIDINGGVDVVNNMVISNSSNSIISEKQEQEQSKNVGGQSCLPKTFILSFDNSTIVPVTSEPRVNLEAKRDSKNKGKRECSEKGEMMMKINEEKGRKKGRKSSQCNDHIMAERKRRQELTERFIALSATIPGLSKVDKASILLAAIDYVKQLQERVHELEKQDKTVGVCGIFNNNADKSSGETNTDEDDCNNNILPEIEARVMEKEVLIEIHCQKQIGIELKLLNHIENLQLFVIRSSVLPFGKSNISITIIAQRSEGYKGTMDDLVKGLRQVILKLGIGQESDLF